MCHVGGCGFTVPFMSGYVPFCVGQRCDKYGGSSVPIGCKGAAAWVHLLQDPNRG